MANEISTNLSVSASTSGQTVSGSASGTLNAGSNGFIGTEILVSTTAAALNLGPATETPPVCVFIKNLDTLNFIQVDAISTMASFPQKILAGQAIYLLPETPTIYAKADTGAVKIWVVAS